MNRVSVPLCLCGLFVSVFSVFLSVGTAQQPPRLDVIIRHGTVFDGSGLPGVRADVGIAGGWIARVGNLSGEHADTEIDAADLYVAPGFINIHSHASPSALPTAENMLTQGVTTEIVNPDGGGDIDLPDQLTRAAADGLAVNVGAYIGFNSIWAHIVGAAARPTTAADIDDMRALVTRGLEQGAWGVSAGLDYKPAYYAQVEDVVRVVEPAARWRTNFPNHDRLTPESGFSSRVGVGETIAIGEKAGLVPVVTHMKSQGREQGGAPTLLAMMRAATDRGHYTAADVYPYLAGQTGLGALLVPAWAQDGGREAMLERFKDPQQRGRIISAIEEALAARFGGPEGVFLPATQQQLVDVMRDEHAGAGETIVRILERGNAPAILRFGSEADLVAILKHPATAIACDCGATINTRQHPRAWGTFPRVLGRYVREQHVLTWEDAIRKMTALPANTIGMVDRGYLAPGMAADVTVFDPRTVIDHATYQDAGQLSDGIRDVIVNGTFALRDGHTTGAHGGRVLRRSPHMPSRAMSSGAERRLSAAGRAQLRELKYPATARPISSSPFLTLAMNVSQRPRDARARGSFTLKIPTDGSTIEATEPGVLQTADGWTAFTARGRVLPSTDERSLLVIVEDADPFVDGHPRTITVAVDGELHVSGVLQLSR